MAASSLTAVLCLTDNMTALRKHFTSVIKSLSAGLSFFISSLTNSPIRPGMIIPATRIPHSPSHIFIINRKNVNSPKNQNTMKHNNNAKKSSSRFLLRRFILCRLTAACFSEHMFFLIAGGCSSFSLMNNPHFSYVELRRFNSYYTILSDDFQCHFTFSLLFLHFFFTFVCIKIDIIFIFMKSIHLLFFFQIFHLKEEPFTLCSNEWLLFSFIYIRYSQFCPARRFLSPRFRSSCPPRLLCLPRWRPPWRCQPAR